MGSFIKLDEFLITNYFEPLAWMFETRFGRGRDNFFLCRLINIATWIVFVVDPIRTHWEWAGILSDWGAIFALCAAILDQRIRDRAKLVRSKPALLNPFRAEYKTRCTIIILGLARCALPSRFGTIDLLEILIVLILVVCGVYFFACNPLPPGWVYARKTAPKLAWQESR
jgi:hypothetical protein